MKCRGCSSEYPGPDVIDGTAYFVCEDCGHVHEIKNYKESSPKEFVSAFEKKYGFKLPDEYIDYSGMSNSGIVKLPACETDSLKYYFGDGFYELGEFFGLNPYEGQSVFDSARLLKEWKLPKNLVLIEGDGHTWLALDYRKTSNKPKVIVIESDKGESLIVASSFKELVSSLIPYENVYDENGKNVYRD